MLTLHVRSSLEEPLGFRGCLACGRKGAVNGYMHRARCAVRGKACLEANPRPGGLNLTYGIRN